MTGFEPLIAAGTAGLTSLVTDIVKGQGSSVLNRFLSQDIGKVAKQVYFKASKRYIQNYTERHGSLKVLGMREPVSLDAVYTAVQVLDCDDRSFASIEDLERKFRTTQVRRLQLDKGARKEGLTIANSKRFLMVLGAPGCGKSTFLRKIGLEALKGTQGCFLKHPCVPIMLELKRFTDPKADIKKLISTEFQTCGFPNAEQFTHQALEQGRLLILLDGLDEVPVAIRDAVIETIQDFVDQHDENRYIASCRIAAYRHNFRRFTDITIAEFDDEQIQQFICNWFQTEIDQQGRTAERCWEILQQPENSAAKELAHTPLLLTFLCLVYDHSQTFSNNRATLYRKALRILLEEWAAEKRIMHQEIYQGLNTELEEVLLSEIAAKSFEADRLFLSQISLVDQIKTFLANNLNAPKHLSGEAVLDAIAVQQGILVERAEDIYSFSHLTLQEYLTARHIVDSRQIEQLVAEHFEDRHWHEVFLLVSGSMVIENGADNLLQAMNQAIQSYAVSIPKLQSLLKWIYQMSVLTNDSQKGAARRAVMLAFTLDRIFDCAIAFSFLFERDSADLYSTIQHSLSLNLARDLAFDLVRALDSALDSALSLDRALNLSLSRALLHKFDLTLDRALERALGLVRALGPLFIGIDCKFIVEKLAVLQATVPKSNASRQTHQQFAAELQKFYVDAFKLNSLLLNLTNKEAKKIENYLYMNYLMVQCKQEASRVSPSAWRAISASMFLPAEA